MICTQYTNLVRVIIIRFGDISRASRVLLVIIFGEGRGVSPNADHLISLGSFLLILRLTLALLTLRLTYLYYLD